MKRKDTAQKVQYIGVYSMASPSQHEMSPTPSFSLSPRVLFSFYPLVLV